MLDIGSEIMFYGSADMSPQNYFFNCSSNDISPQMKILNSYPLNAHVKMKE